MKRSTGPRRMSTVRAGSNRRLGFESLRRCKTQQVAAPSTELRTDKIRNWVVGFLGRNLTAEEEDILMDDCHKIPRDVADHEAARKVVQSLFSAYFVHVRSAQDGDKDGNPQRTPKARTNSIHLEAEAMQVEIMAAEKMQALVRGYLRRQWYNNLPGRQHAAAAAKKWVQENYPRGKVVQSSASSNLTEDSASILLQALMRGFLCRQQESAQSMGEPAASRVESQKQTPIPESVESQKQTPIPEPVADNSESEVDGANPLDQSIEFIHEAQETTDGTKEEEDTTAHTRESLILNAIPETKEVAAMEASITFSSEASLLGESSMQNDEWGKSMSDTSTKHSCDMQLLNASQQQLTFVTEVVKENIVIKVQALARRFLVRRKRRRLLHKAQSIRMLARPSLMHIVKGTPREHEAVTDIQRIFRGYVQRWKYWTAMRQQQLDEIRALKAKQLRKIRERQKSLARTTKKELFFDATILARQLQRAKRVIKFLVKEEKRAIQQNERLAAELAELNARKQLLLNSTKTATNSNETLQQEIQQLTEHNQRLQAGKKEHTQTLKNLTLEWTKTNKQVSAEKQRKEEVKACIAKIKERAKDFLQDHPHLLQDANSLDPPMEEQHTQQEQVTAT